MMLLGDLLAYLDIFAVIFLLSIVGRVETIMLVLKQGAAHATRLARSVGRHEATVFP